MSGTRSFLAIELPANIVAALLDAGETLRGAAPEWRGEKWVAGENLHITLKFLGDRSDADLHALSGALSFVFDETPAFTLELREMAAVPSPRHASMLWGIFGESDDRPCRRLAQAVGEVARDIGVEREGRPFKPHVTVVRARKPRHVSADALSASNDRLDLRERFLSVPSVTLFASTLTLTGPVYRRMAEWPLAGVQ